MSYAQAVEEVKARFVRSVELRLRADVPLAFCLSGGIDSNAIISVAKRVFDYDVHAFTIVNSDARYNEQEYVEHAVDTLGLKYTPLPTSTDDFLSKLNVLVEQHDAPVYTISYFLHWMLMQGVSEQGYRVSVSGAAADELFSGYYDHHLLYLHDIKDDEGLFQSSLAAWEQRIK
ncbi:asparagine synthase-related protein, partial [Fibrobacterota bacterium]